MILTAPGLVFLFHNAVFPAPKVRNAQADRALGNGHSDDGRPWLQTSGGVVAGDVVIECWFSTYPFPGFLEPLEKLAEEFTTAHPGVRVAVSYTHLTLPTILLV